MKVPTQEFRQYPWARNQPLEFTLEKQTAAGLVVIACILPSVRKPFVDDLDLLSDLLLRECWVNGMENGKSQSDCQK